MALNKKYYEAAELELATRREVNAKILENRRKEISLKFPEYANMRKKLAHTGRVLNNLFFSDNTVGNVKNRLEKIEKDNLNIQIEIENLLIKNGYGKDYLDDVYSCMVCRDSGIHSGVRCSCFMNVVKRLASDEINKSSSLNLSRFEAFDLAFYPESDAKAGGKINVREMAKRNLEFCKNYAEDFHLPLGGILMRGATGLGKTHLSLAIAGVVIDKGYSVVYGSVPDLLRKMENEHFNNKKEEETIELVKRSDLLILDDLGAEFNTQFIDSLLYDIINTRINSGFPTIANTNLTLSELKEKYGERLSSRLLTSEILTFYGDDIRIKRKLGK